MNFLEFRESLKFRKYKKWKIIIRFIEYKIKDVFIDFIINFNFLKFSSKPLINIGSFHDNRYINFLLYALRNDYLFAYKKDESTKKLFKRIGFSNFFKFTISNDNFIRKEIIKINFQPNNTNNGEILIDTNYFKYIYEKDNNKLKDNLIMPYYMYPRIYNSFYDKIKILDKPNFGLRIFFSGSVVVDGYGSFFWEREPKKFPNRLEIINKIIKEFKNEIFLINSKQDLKSPDFLKKKIILCLHDKMIKKTSYTLNFKDNFNLLSKSCFNLSCPGVVMPLCHHLIEGIKVGSIPITNCEKLLVPNLTSNNSLNYSNLDQLVEKFHKALCMKNEEIMYMREKVIQYYNSNLSPEYFKKEFLKLFTKKEKKIICCDDHRSVDKFIKK